LAGDTGVCLVATDDGVERAVAADLLVDDDIDHDIPLGGEPELFQILDCEHVAGDATLHVAGTAAVDPSILDRGRPRVIAPALTVAARNDVGMAVEQQRTTAARSLQSRNDVWAVLITTIDWTIAGMLFQLFPIGFPHVDFQADLLEIVVHVLLNRRL